MSGAGWFWLGFMTCAWLATVGGVGYVIYRYVWAPWQVLRKDITGLATGLTSLKEFTEQALVSRRGTAMMTDEEIAGIERRLRRESADRNARDEATR